jgi:DNA-binding NarL/FixJ family response regulator
MVNKHSHLAAMIFDQLELVRKTRQRRRKEFRSHSYLCLCLNLTMTIKRNFLLVEDEALIREGLKSLLENESFVKNVYEASNKKEFMSTMDEDIDFVLMDFKLQDTNGLELLQSLRKKSSSVKVVAVTGRDGSELVLNLLKAGVNGIVYKLDGYREIRKTIEMVMEGESYFPESVMSIIRKNAHRWDSLPPVTLTFAENELLTAIARGLITKEIAVELKMTEATIETYRQRLMKKVGVQNTAALIAYGFRNGLL